MSALLVITSAPATQLGEDVYLDKKYVEGMRLYAELWDGPVTGVLRPRAEKFPFGEVFSPDQLPFDIRLLSSEEDIGVADIAAFEAILCCGDNFRYLHLAELCKKSGKKIAYSIENIPRTRRQIIFLDRANSIARKIYSTLWTMNQERRRRKAFSLADGIQANGYPAFETYGPLNRKPMMYLDNRIGDDQLATPAEVRARSDRLLSGAPVRLIHSGRLEPLKGSQDLVKVALQLRSENVDFELNIFGSGSLEEELRREVSQAGLDDRVKLHGAVDFETELVPFSRQHADIYLSCHRQSDPSCTYIESMGCGLAVVGYSNRMWSSLCKSSEAGWTAPMGDTAALARQIAQAAGDRRNLAAKCETAWKFAKGYSFENEFRRRIDHIREITENR